MTSSAALLLIHAETPMHPGTGSAQGAVDLPVAREKSTGLPLVPGSSLKGILRDAARRAHGVTDDNDGPLWEVFGGDTNHASDAAGALAITDARLLAFPLRSLSGLFAWTTCPAVLERFVRDARVGGVTGPVVDAAKALLKEAEKLGAQDKLALVPKDSPLLVGKSGQLVFEEFDYTATQSTELTNFGKALDEALGSEGMRLKSHLAVISDNAFAFSTRYATEVSARIKLDPQTKTVQNGALFYQEFLPAGTLFSALMIAEGPHPRKGDKARPGRDLELNSATDVLTYVSKALSAGADVLQVGGNASIGKGLCTVKLISGKGN
jgi:CRISPR-associated protein Cmr4